MHYVDTDPEGLWKFLKKYQKQKIHYSVQMVESQRALSVVSVEAWSWMVIYRYCKISIVWNSENLGCDKKKKLKRIRYVETVPKLQDML